MRDYPSFFVSLDKFVDPNFCYVPFFRQAARNLDVTLSQTPVEENSLLHEIRVHHLQLLSHSLKEGKYDNIKEDDDTRSDTSTFNNGDIYDELRRARNILRRHGDKGLGGIHGLTPCPLEFVDRNI